MSLLAALFVGATAGTPLNILRTRGGGGEDFRSSSTFATKHTSAEPASLEGLLAAVDIDHLDRNAHVVATLGPASSDEDTIRALIRAGVNIFRLNASHRRPGDFEALVPLIREAAQQAGREVRILGDIQGPKFRCTPTKGGVPVALRAGQIVEFALCGDEALCSHGSDVEDLTRPGRITLTPTSEQTALVRGVAPGMAVLLDDGALALTVLASGA
jgi:pyruvate kinase